jgi:ABC-type glycerol-3-phosphate transport system substrate-binding protein
VAGGRTFIESSREQTEGATNKMRRIIAAILSVVAVASCASAAPSGTATTAPTTYASPIGVPVQVPLDALAEMGFQQQGAVTDVDGEATYSLNNPASGAAVVGGDPVVAIVLSGTMDMAPTARMFLTRFGPPDALAWFNELVPRFAAGTATEVGKQFALFRLDLQPNRHLSKNGFSLSVRR